MVISEQAISQAYESIEGGIYIFKCIIFTNKHIVYMLNMHIHVFVKSKRIDTFLIGTQNATE